MDEQVKALIDTTYNVPAPGDTLIQKRAFVLVTVYSDADSSILDELRLLPSVIQVDRVLGAFDAVITVEGNDDSEIQQAVAAISVTRGVKEAKPLMEAQVGPRGRPKQVIGRA